MAASMRKICVALALTVWLGGAARAQELRIGMLTTQTGGGAVIGQEIVRGWQIGLQHENWSKDGDKIGGVPLRMFYADDQAKSDVALKEVERFVSQDHVHIVAGLMWSHIVLAVQKPLVESKKLMLSLLASPAPILRNGCTPYFISTSIQNEEAALAAGDLLNGEGIKTLYVLAPNYQAGKEIIAGALANFKGKTVGQELFKLGESDFQTEISKLRAAKPDAVLFFGPGAMGVSFVKQWHASGAGREIKLFAHYVVDETTLAAIGDAAIGTLQITSWPQEAGNEVNARFVKDYVAKFNRQPSFFAAQGYDGPRLIATALESVSGKFEDAAALMRAMRHTAYPSTRPYLGYNANGLPMIQYYKSEIVTGPGGKPQIKVHGPVPKSTKYSHLEDCPAANRL